MNLWAVAALALVVMIVGRSIRANIRNSKNEKVAENNAAVILGVYNQLIKEGGNQYEEPFADLCYLVLQDTEYADAALKLAKQQASSQGETLSLKRVAFSILVGQMFMQKGVEPSDNEKTIAFAAVKKVIGW